MGATILLVLAALPLVLAGVAWSGEDDVPALGAALAEEAAGRLAAVARAGITRVYPHKPGDVWMDARDVKGPDVQHPAFYGCFDWHSAVHGHWTLVRLLRLHPRLPGREEAIRALDGNLTAENLAAEAAYFDKPSNRAFERTYGWAWLLRLAQELRAWDDDLARRWAVALRPLEDRIVGLWRAYLPKLTAPVRSGEHRDTAFGLAFAIDYARAVDHEPFETELVAWARSHYLDDRDYPVRYEPSGHDFFSAGLNEADLMRRVVDAATYGAWLDAFLPSLRRGELGPWTQPATVSDVTDGKLVHLAGLNLTRAWTARGIASALPEGDARRTVLGRLAENHARAGFAYVFSGDYAGEHWLASFAVYLLTDAGLPTE